LHLLGRASLEYLADLRGLVVLQVRGHRLARYCLLNLLRQLRLYCQLRLMAREYLLRL
jgi:hypothetical protein